MKYVIKKQRCSNIRADATKHVNRHQDFYTLSLLDLMENWYKIFFKLNKISKTPLSDGLFGNPRPLYNINMAKVSFVKWFKIFFFFFLQKCHFWHTYFFLIVFFNVIYLRKGQKRDFWPQKSSFETTFNIYFDHITIMKKSLISKKSIKNSFLRYFFRLVFH